MKLSLVALLAALTTTVYCGADPNAIWECGHGHQERPEPEMMDIEEDYNPSGNDNSGRTLTSYNNLRTYGYYGLLSTATSTMRSYVENELIPPILDYFGAALKVKYPVSGLFKISSSTICSVSTPSVLKSGVSADYVYMVTTDDDSSYVASSYACSLASGSHRPLVGHTVISTYFMEATSDVLLHEKNMICIMHEVVHTLGFSNSYFSYWLNSAGQTLTGHIESTTLDGMSTVVINAEPLTGMLRTYFGCPTLKGAYMENQGGAGSAGTHFERRQFGFEAMTSGLIYQMQFSQFTLGILESTGWYVADYSYADPFFFGQGQGCNYLTESCSTKGFSFEEFCTGSGRGCANPGRGGGTCTTDSRSDSCGFYHPVEQYDCEYPGSESYARLPSLQTFGRGLGSKCFTGTLTSAGSSASSTTYCFKYSCAGSGSSTELTLDLNGKSVLCTSEGPKSVSGYSGTINCPNPLTFCSTVGQKICPRGCMGRGTCVNGVCSCNNGYTGTDCALNA